ncbi:unnamed protein product [Strongylus vulgaris]|uniref:Uncharacterized protein n=1 Tax=Strongylus vulgaris TaxID=40348 RepID=A0A3P7JAF9_STRVU|nr:unnamed protein product [Strongylus vulgaris]
MILIFLLVGATLGIESERKLTLTEAERLKGAALYEYLKKQPKHFQVGDSPRGKEGMKNLIDPRYIHADRGAPRVKVSLADEELPEK